MRWFHLMYTANRSEFKPVKYKICAWIPSNICCNQLNGQSNISKHVAEIYGICYILPFVFLFPARKTLNLFIEHNLMAISKLIIVVVDPCP